MLDDFFSNHAIDDDVVDDFFPFPFIIGMDEWGMFSSLV